jgi:chromosome segregation protein
VRLTQIKLSGFKSFVDPTVIHVPGQLVGIVGPNGCGKSNVIDAVRWVLGETRASALRGDSMQDVIFNGSSNRKPLARASVELAFDNSLGRAAGQWSQYADIVVKRVLQRDGESSYFINNIHVRRRDITDMFLGTGLGPRAYAIIEQGMISRVIEAKPEELRVFLEEAAGVSRYKERRRETENRLADTRENLARVTDIRGELGTQIEKLEAQAEVASRYKGYQADLQLKQQLLWYLRRRDAGAEREKHAQEIGKTVNALEAETSALREVESRIETARAAHYTAGDALNAAQAALYAANSEVARLESELRYAEETRQRLENQHTERRAQLESWRSQRSQLTQALHMWVSRTGSARAAVERTKAALADEGAKLAPAEQEFRASQERLNEARSELLRSESALQLEAGNLAHLERNLQSLAQRRDRLATELAALPAPDDAGVTALEQRIAEVDAALASAQQQVDSLQQECSADEAALAQESERLASLRREQAALEAQLATLRQIQAAVDENAPLEEWLSSRQLSNAPRLWQKLRIEPGWEAAVEAVLRERLHALQLATGAELGAMGAEPPPVRASLFCAGGGAQGTTLSAALPGYAALASKVQVVDASIAGAVADWFASVYVCEGAVDEAARAALPPGAVLVSREGHQFTRYTASFHGPDAADAGLLARSAEIEALGGRSAALEASLAQARGEVAAREQALARHQQMLEAARDAVATHNAEQHEAQIEMLKLTQRKDRYSERHAQIQGELAEIAGEDERDSARLAEAKDKAAGLEEKIRAARGALEAVRSAYIAAETALAEQRIALQRAEREAQDALFSEREHSSKITEIDNSVRMIDQQIVRAEAEIAKLTEELAEDPIPAVREQLDAAVEVRLGCEKTLGEARNTVEEAAGVLRGLEEEKLHIEGRMAPLRDRSSDLRLKEQAAQLSYEQFAGQLAESGADEQLLGREAENAARPATLQGEITRLSQAVNELGAVNLAALEEVGTARERKTFLDTQAIDLDEAVTTLEDAIRRIDRETRELLKETFESVNRHFGSLFPALFGGGEARLNMTGEEILDAGVQVMAQPPGKRNTSIHLLSGGEKALTAIALVFSMFQLNPAPFCLLDEVDAPLDDSNTVRFSELVKKMAQQTQFLFISHNKIAMEMAQQLIGVTMPESGVSRVVAVDIDEALRMREELAA